MQLFAAVFFVVVSGSLIIKGFTWRTQWDQIVDRNEIIVAVRESEGIYWPVGQEISGFERGILEEIETQLGISISTFAVRNLDDLYQALEVGAVDMAITGTSNPSDLFQKSLPYYVTSLGIVRKKNTDFEPSDELVAGILDPLAHALPAQQLISQYPNLEIQYEPGRLSAELMTLVDIGSLDLILLDERDFHLQQTVFPDLLFFPIESPSRDIRILFHSNHDGTLLSKVNNTIKSIQDSGLMVQMIDRYFGHAGEFDFVDNRTFERHMASRLPRYRAWFEQYAEQNNLDWRLLAAVAYQESHWRANAVSPTGVRGIMMVTQATAKDMGISNRSDPQQSIDAGSRYLSRLIDRVPEQITEPDRTWFALAAYNVGAGHVEDARKITEIEGGNPNIWIDVRKSLPKLALKSYYPWTTYGYARGNEPVVYVGNIRQYYEKMKKAFPKEGDSIQPDRLDQLPEAEVPIFQGL
ncbi:membrane-bound lytic murein transglycosylase MltF [Reinekea forsetii]|nr:membrane-bound lytic murein transglycosylase MltF [Reinekea forsetii]